MRNLLLIAAFAFLRGSPMEAPRMCEEHTYNTIRAEGFVNLDSLNEAVDMWHGLRHDVANEDGEGTVFMAVDPDFLDMLAKQLEFYGGSILGATQRVGDSCIVRLRSPDDWHIMAHEIGHCLCYDDWYEGPKHGVMAPVYDQGMASYPTRGLRR